MREVYSGGVVGIQWERILRFEKQIPSLRYGMTK